MMAAVLSLGGNVQTVGEKADGSLWQVGIADPNDTDRLVGTLTLGESAAVTSGAYQQSFTQNGHFYHHILDPANGYPSDSGLTSVTVVTPDGTAADALSTALFVMGREKGMALYRQNGDFEAVFITEEQKVYLTDGLRDSFRLDETNGYSYGT